MYQGYPDFQQIIVTDQHRFIATYQQNNSYLLYPEAVSILVADPLAFSLDIVRSPSTDSIYGWLNFTTELQYADEQSLMDFKQQHPDSSVKVLPVLPGSLGFDVPIEYHSAISGQSYDATWYSAQCIQFIILLNSASTQLIEKTLLDDTIGFNARLDGFVEGVSPRLAYSVEFDPRVLMLELAAGVKGAQPIGDDRVAFDYGLLTQYIYQNIALLPLQISPLLPVSDPSGNLLFSQALLDRLYTMLGSPYAGPASSNTAMIALEVPAQGGRVIFNLDSLVLSRRPLCFILDPFAAAQQIAKVSPDTIIHRSTAPPLPAGEREIDVFYVVPLGLKSNASVDIQLTVPPGDIYPLEQTQTQMLDPDQSRLTFKFHNSALEMAPFFYQIRVNYPQDGSWRTLNGKRQPCDQRALVLDYAALPCPFLTISLDQSFAQQSRIGGFYHSAGWLQDVALSAAEPYFSCPILGDETFIEATAYQLAGSGVVPLPAPITQATTIGAYSFPQFGSQRARITVILPSDMLKATLAFQPQNQSRTTEHTFTHQQDSFDYPWTVTSIFASGFRYQMPSGLWSAYVTGDQTIDVKGEK
ncbi:hypothetical protein R6Y99_05345 [Pseudomonas lundensis]|uniref:hypothetical protein n=1 Tax=Serratia proteamaculans TaxID=28151 RepID=UPI0029818F8A|nr:hypothetical protein [Serratia proteamaculans]MDW5499214.1 hypothetical protein [Serratia proteamaculans]MDW5504276.1 hypothetical protein [Pseudomonas lundensis]